MNRTLWGPEPVHPTQPLLNSFFVYNLDTGEGMPPGSYAPGFSRSLNFARAGERARGGRGGPAAAAGLDRGGAAPRRRLRQGARGRGGRAPPPPPPPPPPSQPHGAGLEGGGAAERLLRVPPPPHFDLASYTLPFSGHSRNFRGVFPLVSALARLWLLAGFPSFPLSSPGCAGVARGPGPTAKREGVRN